MLVLCLLAGLWSMTQNGVTVMHGNSLVKYGSKEGLPASDIIKVVRFNDKLYAATRTKGLYVFDGGMFSKSSLIKGNDIQTMNVLGDNLFISTNLENIFYDGSIVSFIKGKILLYVILFLFELYVIILFRLDVILNKSFS